MFQKCSLCGKDNLLINFKTSSNLYLCPKCYGKIPCELADYALKEWDKLDFDELDFYKQTSKALKFNKTTSLGVLLLDENKGLYTFENSDVVYDMNNLSEFNFGFEIDESGKTKSENKRKMVDYVVQLSSDFPRHVISVPLVKKMSVPIDTKDEDLMSYVSDAAKEFTNRFISTFKDSKERILSSEFNITPESLEKDLESVSKDVLHALKVMEYESLEGVSRRGLTRRKNKLLKPEVLSMEYVKEVNEAYKLLLAVIAEMEKDN